MSIGSGNISLTRFKLIVKNQQTPFDWLLKQLSKHMISPLQADDLREEAKGFCHPFTGDSSISSPHQLIYGGSFVFAYRIDKKKIPATFLKFQLRHALESLGHANSDEQGGSKRVSKKLRESIRNQLKEELLRMTLPNVRLIEIVWHLDSNEIWFMNTSSALIDEFKSVFFEVFSHVLYELNPGTLAIDFERIQLDLKVSLQPLLDIVPVIIGGYQDIQSIEKQTESVF